MRRALPAFLVLALAGTTLFIALRSRTAGADRVGVPELPSKDAPVLPPPERAALVIPVPGAIPAPEPPAKQEPLSEAMPEDAARVEAPVAAPEWVQEILRSTPESWMESHKGKSSDERQAEREKITAYIHEQSYDELVRRRESKEWEFLAPTQAVLSRTYHGTKEDEALIYSVVMIPEGVYRVVLPRDQFPDLYTLKERVNALNSMR